MAVAARLAAKELQRLKVMRFDLANADLRLGKKAYSGADVDTVAGLYADRVDYTNSGVISKAAVRAEAPKYFARWPVRRWSLVGPLTTVSLGIKKKMIFSASYDVSNPQTNNHTSGIAKETLILTTDASGAMKIVSQKEQTNKNPAAEAQVVEKANSPDGKYSIEVVRGRPSEDSLVISKGEEVIAKVPTPVGPEGSFFQTLWSPDEKYVAINKQRSSRSGGDEMWIVALPSGKVLRQPEDALGNEVGEKADKAWALIDEKHLLTESGRKEFLTLTASGWENSRLRFKLEAEFSEIEDRYLFEGLLDPAELKVSGWKVSTANSTSSGNGDKPADLAIKQKLLGYWKFPKALCYIAADGKMWVGPRKNEMEADRWNVKNGNFYWGNVAYTIVTLTDNKFVFREIGGQREPMTLIRSTKEEVNPE